MGNRPSSEYFIYSINAFLNEKNSLAGCHAKAYDAFQSIRFPLIFA